MSKAAVYVGIDVSKARLDVALLPSAECWDVANDEEGIATRVSLLEEAVPAPIVLEATGSYENAAVAALAAATLPVAVVNPRQQFLTVCSQTCTLFRPGRHLLPAANDRITMKNCFQFWREVTRMVA